MSQMLAGKTALVTGGASGIGFAIARRLVFDGAKTAIADIALPAAERAAAKVGPETEAWRLDVADGNAFSQLADELANRWGHIDILVNNAGIAGRSAPTWELGLEEWQQVIDIDLTGVFNGCRAVIPFMRTRRYGRIINIASIAGKEGNPNAVPYSAAKAGVIGLTKAVAKEVVGDGILVNCITPAVIQTELLQQMSEDHIRYMVERIPMRRVGKPEEVAAMVAWLASDQCSFSTGAVFDISGGRATY